VPKPVGVLCLQGDFREHLQVFHRLGIEAIPVKTIDELNSISGLVLPGGESTAIAKLANNFGLTDHIRNLIKSGLPTFGTCAGLILLANNITEGIVGQETFGGLNVVVQRNAFGNQLDSFEVDLAFNGVQNMVHAAFIRAPLITQVGDGVEVVAALDDGRVVGVRQGNLLGISFHPEVTGEDQIHKFFYEQLVLPASE
jgi:5'-phosphate synthase pdxT subunit